MGHQNFGARRAGTAGSRRSSLALALFVLPLESYRSGLVDHLNFDYLHESGSCIVGDPDECIETAKRYEAAGCDLLLCLVNPYKIPHDDVMQSIELIGKHVIPEFA